MGDMAHNTPLARGQILPRTLGPITHLGMLRPITPQRFQALSIHLATAQPVSGWMYPQQDCQTEAPPLRGQVPGYPASQNSGMRVPYYTYGDGDHSVPQPGPTIRPQEDSWAPPGAYGMGTWYPWPSAVPSAPPGSLYMNESTSSWPSSGSPQPPPSPPPLQPKDSSYAYSQADQGMSRHNFPCGVHQYESSGSVNDDSSELLDSQVQYSAEPHLYGNATHKHPSTQDQGIHLAEECLSSDEGTPPSIKKNHTCAGEGPVS